MVENIYAAMAIEETWHSQEKIYIYMYLNDVIVCYMTSPFWVIRLLILTHKNPDDEAICSVHVSWL